MGNTQKNDPCSIAKAQLALAVTWLHDQSGMTSCALLWQNMTTSMSLDIVQRLRAHNNGLWTKKSSRCQVTNQPRTIKHNWSLSRITRHISIPYHSGCHGLLLVVLAQLFNCRPRSLTAKTSKSASRLETGFLLTEN